MKLFPIHYRINLLLYATGLFFLVLLFRLYLTTDNQEKLILKESELQFQNEINALITNKQETLNQVAYDYTFWNEFVNQLNLPDTAWYTNNITTILKSFRVDYVAVYDSSFHLIHEVSSPSVTSRGFATEEILNRIKEVRLLDFFLVKPEGLFDISAASIHPDNDPTHMLTRPSGYLILAKNWTSLIASSDIRLGGAIAALKLGADTIADKGEYLTTAAVRLNDWNKRVFAHITFTRSSNLLKLYRNSSFYMIFTMLISIIITWFVINFTFRRWVTKPLKLVTSILKSEDTSHVNELKQCPGEFKQIGMLFSDFMDQKKELLLAKEKAEESELLKSAFLANMSHEIRTPMNGILGFVELLKEPKLSGEEQQQYIGIIEESGKRMLNIINDIICISKVEAGHVEVVTSETIINDQMRYIYTFFKPEADSKGIKLIYKTGLSDLESNVWTDREKLYAILTNLVKNAIKFTNSGFIEFGYERKGKFLEFFVKDTGVGIRQDKREMIFERFRQVSESLSRNYEGAGLGLAISKAFVEIMGGRIWVESELGEGSSFFFAIPFIEQKIVRTTPFTNELNMWDKLNISGLKIVIAEDDATSYLFLSKLIKSMGGEILKVMTGTDAVGVCRKNPDVDLVLMDIQMSEMNGYEATRRIREFNKNLVIIAQTALGLKGERERAMAAGCTDFLTKPFSMIEFNELIRKYFKAQVRKF
jgi:signal transduction histidine kinase/CheY-like chemotaxis protein